MPNLPPYIPTDQYYDHEMLAIERIGKTLEGKTRSHRDIDSFDREIKGRFLEIGIVVDVVWYELDENNQKMFCPEINILGRVEEEKHGFDFERMQYEVVNDILEIAPDADKKLLPFNPDMLHDEKLGKHKHV